MTTARRAASRQRLWGTLLLRRESAAGTSSLTVDLLNAAEAAGFQVLLTTDKNIQYQQNLAGRKISVLVLANSQWPVVRLHLGSIATAVNAAKPGGYTEVEIPKR